ncbi:invasin, partial [Escherichia coli]|nr:invasin [Escherichia coli]
ATLKLEGWSKAAESAAYAITAGTAAEAQSAIAVDKDSYKAGDSMTVTVTLKDKNGNGVSGQASALTTSAVTVANSAAFSGSWTDNKDGTYTAAYTAKIAGTGLKATMKLEGWSNAAESAAYAITA